MDSIENLSGDRDTENVNMQGSLGDKKDLSSVKYGEINMIFEDSCNSDKEYFFSENCATQLMITNHYDNQIVVDKIILMANEIEVDYSPVLTFSNGGVTEDGLSVSITNTGWGSAKNIKVKMSDPEKDLEDYLKKEALEFEIPSIDVAESVDIPFLKNSDLLDYYSDNTDFHIDFEVECESDGMPVIYSEVGFYIYQGKLTYGGIGGYATNLYGIKIDTEKDSYYWEESILEFIDQGETLVMPVYFFPDKSCSLQLEIIFEIINDGKAETISTDVNEMHFSVASIPGWNYVINHPIEEVSLMSEDELKYMDSETIISYPYSQTVGILP